MLELDVVLAAAGAAGFTFGLVRTRWSGKRTARTTGVALPADHDAGSTGGAPASEAVADPGPDDDAGRS